MWRVEHVHAAVVDHRAPAWGGRLHAQAEEAQCRFGEDRPSHAERGLNSQRRERGRQDVANQDARRRRADRVRRDDIFELSRLQYLRTHDSCVPDPPNRRQGEHDVRQARAEYGHESDREQQPRERQQDIDEAADCLVNDAAVVASNGSDRSSNQGRHRHDDETNDQRDSRSGEHARQDVSPQFVEPEPV
jgi:hypothetical protein